MKATDKIYVGTRIDINTMQYRNDWSEKEDSGLNNPTAYLNKDTVLKLLFKYKKYKLPGETIIIYLLEELNSL